MTQYLIGPGAIFTLFFITLGPLKVLGPFAHRTHALAVTETRKIAFTAFVIGTIGIIVGGFVGSFLLANWHVSLGAMTVAAGIIFLLVALKQLLEQYKPAPAVEAAPLPASPAAAAMQILFPVVLTPYGIAAVIALLAGSDSARRAGVIVVLLVVVMILNLLAMLFARRILVGVWLLILKFLGGILGVLQAALAVTFIIAGLRMLHILGP